MSLSDFFPAEFTKSHFQSSIDLGAAFLIEIPTFSITYKKFAIYYANDILKEGNCGLLVINSEINENVNNSAYLKSQHVLIDCSKHPFLQYDSFVDCTQIHNHPKKEIVASIVANPSLLKGNVDVSIMLKIHDILIKSKTISNRDKRRYSII